jgi:tetratricopeptide (TPR) repeat protein
MNEQQEQALSDAKSALEMSARVPHRAIEVANSALLFAKSGDHSTQAYGFAALGCAYTSLNRFEEATRFLNESLHLAIESRLSNVTARIHQARGWIAHQQGNPVQAFADWQTALEYFRQVRDVRGICWILMHYAVSYTSLGLIDHSIQCRVSALDLVDQAFDKETEFEIRIGLADSYLERAWNRTLVNDNGFAIIDAQIATSLVLDVIARSQDDLNPLALGIAYRVLGESLVLQHRTDAGIANIHQSREFSVRVGGYRSEARLQGIIGFAKFIDGKFEDAISHLEQAIHEAHEITTVKDLVLIHHWYAKALEANGDTQQALKVLWKTVELENQLQNHRLDYWGQMHDFTIGLNDSLRDAVYVSQRENDWYFSDDQLDRHAEHLEHVSKIDLVSGAFNRTYGLSQVNSQSFSRTAIYDISNLELINGRFGRRTGDQVLKNAVSAIASNFDDRTVLVRFSGTEILVASNQSAEVFKQAVETIQNFPWIAIDPELTVSVRKRFVNPDRPNLLAA